MTAVETTPPLAASAAARVAMAEDVGPHLLRRWFGTVVDMVVLALAALGPVLAIGENGDQNLLLAALLFGVVFVLGYYPIGEGLWGRTVGKVASGMVVVDEHGQRPGFGRAIVRTLARLIEVNPFLFGGIPAAIAVIASKRRQRIGDMVASTYVIPAKALAEMRESPASVFS
jgi:uncharacterized RDD family membrane protein YckC